MPPAEPGGDPDERPARFEVAWRLEVQHPEPATLAAALAPESEGHHDLVAEEDQLVAKGQGRVGQSLHTLDDLLACLTAAVDTLEISQGSDR